MFYSWLGQRCDILLAGLMFGFVIIKEQLNRSK